MGTVTARHPAPPRESDAFGLIRLVLAGLVIAAHTPELTDGNRGRELLTRAFGTISFGELAVDGFFIVSGFLITGSCLSTRSLRFFAAKRAVRLLPGFWLASLVCVAIVAPLAGGSWSGLAWPRICWSLVTLHDIAVPHIFRGLPYPSLDGAMWTLGFEARCYVLIALLSLIGLLHRPLALGVLAGICLIGALFAQPPLLTALVADPAMRLLIDDPHTTLRFAGQFLAGAALWHAREKLRPTRWSTILALAALIVGLSQRLLAEAAVASAGAWLILSWSLHPSARWMTRMNRRDDVSYGVYLYAWPVTNLLLWYVPGLPLIALGVLTLAGSLVMGFISWRLVERPAHMALQRGIARHRRRHVEKGLVAA